MNTPLNNEYTQYLKWNARNMRYVRIRGYDAPINKILIIKQLIFSRCDITKDTYAKGINTKPYRKCKKILRRMGTMV